MLIISQIQFYFRQANQWLSGTPERALDQAYRAALKIKAIEDEHFNGKKISNQNNQYGTSVISYFKSDLNKNLNVAKVRLAEFKISRSLVNSSDKKPPQSIPNSTQYYSLEVPEEPAIIIEKLNFIDSIIKKYASESTPQPSASLIVAPKVNVIKLDEDIVEPRRVNYKPTPSNKETGSDVDTATEKTGVVPRSILRTIKRIKRELDPKAEEEVVKNFRNSKNKTIISIKFLLLLILIPLLTQQLTKSFIVSPVIDYVREKNKIEIFINVDLEEEALMELERFEKQLKFKQLIGLTSALSPIEVEEQLKEKALEIKKEYTYRSDEAIKNVFADFCSLIAFGVVIASSKRDIAVLKSFIDEIVYGLSDSAKAFIIILLTDVFVGYHSPHGWEVILKGIAWHLGVPENEEFNYLFIATFPVILDTVFKYWIFRYLNRISPSAVATYRNMNE